MIIEISNMFSFLKETFAEGLKKIKDTFGLSENIHDIELIEKTLLNMNFMPDLVSKIISKVKQCDEPWKNVLERELNYIFNEIGENNKVEKDVVILIGINGSGKTTTAIKFGRQNKDKKTLLIPADTFRAAAKNQLEELATKFKIDFFHHDIVVPSAVIYQGAQYAKANNYKKIIIDTAGRIHQSVNLMKELSKSVLVAKKQFGENACSLYLVLDGLQGKNLLEQAILFQESITIDGLIITKLDGGVKPGTLFSIVAKLKIPIVYVSFGQQNIDLEPFEFKKFIHHFLS